MCTQCPVGHYCLGGTLYLPCPAGYYCPPGTGLNWVPCPRGTYGSEDRLHSATDCRPCDGGAYCSELNATSTTGSCAAGFFCTSGVSLRQPLVNTGNCSLSGDGDICPVGHFCPENSTAPRPCDPGTYADVRGLASCHRCPSGYYCNAGTVNFTSTPCDEGCFCPSGSAVACPQQCAAGTFRNTTGARNQTDCLPCRRGHYCDRPGLTKPTGLCSAGWYCTESSIGAKPNNTTGARCPVGTFCPEGSDRPTPCSPGSYCAIAALPAPSAECQAGYYCITAAATSTPTDGTTGDVCPKGAYCPMGSSSPTLCPEGTFANASRGTNIEHCDACVAGEFCMSSGLHSPSGLCSAGFYCERGSNSSRPLNATCPVGHRCPVGSASPIVCTSGEYQDTEGQSECLPCPEGFYCDTTLSPVVDYGLFPCPVGHVCPRGTTSARQFPCLVGTFSNRTRMTSTSQCSNCTAGNHCDAPGLSAPSGPCSPGYFCMKSARRSNPDQLPDAGLCPEGRYCPSGTSDPVACPEGSHANVTGLASAEECFSCPPGMYCERPGLANPSGLCSGGYFCDVNATRAAWLPCIAGHYCPIGSGVSTPCPRGTYYPSIRASSVDECLPCTSGSYCGSAGLSRPSGPCDPGYHCPPGQSSPRPPNFNCSAGYHCPGNTSDPLLCPNGTYTDRTHASSCSPCPAGDYCLEGAIVTSCPRGYYCPQGTGNDWQPCPRGTYGNSLGLTSHTECVPCDGGMYCSELHLTAASGPCFAGYFCQHGVDRPDPGNGTNATDVCSDSGHLGVGGTCPLGHHCPLATAIPLPCRNGSYSPITGLSACLPCPQGFFCAEGSTDYINQPCPVGYYCPEGTASPTQNPCSPGTYNARSHGKNDSHCLDCDPGSYCSSPGLSSTSGLCDGGWFCTRGATSVRPNSTREGGGPCPVGFYCPTGSSSPIPCTGGSYCDRRSLAQPTGPCQAGFFCSLASSSPQPLNMTGGRCPPGSYCLNNSSAPTPCPKGTFSPDPGNTNASSCTPCTAGSYCPESGLTRPTGPCLAGYYCPPGQFSPSAFECSRGHYCVNGSAEPRRCSPGSYQNATGRSACETCPKGYFCDTRLAAVVDFVNSTCPAGYFCPSGTARAYEHPCPSGTYSDRVGSVNSSLCSDCDGGRFCSTPGLTQPQGKCSAGYYCLAGARSPTPRQGLMADICPSGHYCPQATSTPVTCPLGTFNPVTQQTSLGSCRACEGGFYCGDVGLSNYSTPCRARYYCPARASNATWLICPRGKYCPERTAVPINCPPGTFNPFSGKSEVHQCQNCTPGFYCQGGSSNATGSCSEGYYCPEGTSSPTPASFPCPIGYQCPQGSATPQNCPPGRHTNSSGQSSCTLCPKGSYCTGALTRPCPRGHFCPVGTGLDWVPCPSGTFSNIEGLHAESQCQSCPPQFFCNGTGAVAVTDYCLDGYFCTSGNWRPDPINMSFETNTTRQCRVHQPVGGECQPGFYCPRGSAQPTPCPPGSFTNTSGNAECRPCPEGHFCPIQTSDFSMNICPVGHYCLVNTTRSNLYPCPAGTYNPASGMRNASACLPCTPGLYCSSPGQAVESGPCNASFYCLAGSVSPRPGASRCPMGSYCPSGSPLPVPCDAGHYCSSIGLSNVSGPCDAGYYCNGSSVSQRPADTTGAVCPRGAYCPQGSPLPVLCPPSTFLNATGSTSRFDCRDCSAGHYCAGYGLEVPSGPCDVGYYCPTGQNSSRPAHLFCPAGHFCPLGSPRYQLCASGTYQPRAGQGGCTLCPGGYFCDPSGGPVVSLNNSLCPTGHYCPNGTRSQGEHPCPSGTFNNRTGLITSSQCAPCSWGMSCTTTGLSLPDAVCQAGYYCRSGARSITPDQGESATLCPSAHFCPRGVGDPVACPIGTFSSALSLASESQCSGCTPGYACTLPAQTAPNDVCSSGFYCPGNSTHNSTSRCPMGHYCPARSGSPTPCPPGTFSDSTGQSELSSCRQCLPGMFCDREGLAWPAGSCTAGFYCPLGTVLASNPNTTCTFGQHCPTGSTNPRPCPDGFFTNQTGMSQCQPCPAGHYCIPVEFSNGQAIFGNSGNCTNTRAIRPCPAGFYCPRGTGLDWLPCPRGTYSNRTGLANSSQCQQCDGGYFCRDLNATAVTGMCDGGHFCRYGVDRSRPVAQLNGGGDSSGEAPGCSVGNHTGIGGQCGAGEHCPPGTTEPLPCPERTFNSIVGQSSCSDCPAGFYCPGNVSDLTALQCPPGYYCPSRTSRATELPCPPGTFNPLIGQTNVSSCRACTPGRLCDGNGLFAPSANCTAGWYCSGGSSTVPNGTTGGICQPGYYCPESSNRPVPCDGGHYCDRDALPTPTGECNAGYFCSRLSTSSTPASSPFAGPCPVGSYCPQGSVLPLPCPPGTYLNATRQTSVSDCTSCRPGYYCGASNLSEPTGQCNIGFYCPEGQNSSRPASFICPNGHYCPAGSERPVPCDSGFYQSATGQGTCLPCPPGFYCDSRDGVVVLNATMICPKGHFCPGTTRFSFEYPCPIGSFNNRTGLSNHTECSPCSAGFACATSGIEEPAQLCSPGFFCASGARSRTPMQLPLAGVCPPGSFCPEGSGSPIHCPPGSFSNISGLRSANDCTLCTAGMYCNAPGLVRESGPCSAGYYCPRGSASAAQVLCPSGSFCPEQSVTHVPCPRGTYSNTTNLRNSSECRRCDAGMHCNATGLTEPTGVCYPGYFCLSGSMHSRPNVCPSGLHCPEGAPLPSSCLPGTFTNTSGRAACDTCPAGFYCLPVAVFNASSAYLPCPAGYFCPPGTGRDWQPCPAGSYSNNTRLSSPDQCADCPGGQYCRGGRTVPDGPCNPGYYCLTRASRSDPRGDNFGSLFSFFDSSAFPECPAIGRNETIGAPCPVGHFCEMASSLPTPCRAGSYNDLVQQSKCKACPAGFFCLEGANSYITNNCTPGHFCPENTTLGTEYPCPAGSYLSITTARSNASCLPCPPGSYCQGVGRITPTGPCPGGWFCSGGATQPRPSHSDQGGECPPGQFCPNASSASTACLPGFYCNASGLSAVSGPCQEGYVCLSAAVSPRPNDNVTGHACPKGHYCPLQSARSLPCPVGTYLNRTHATAREDCQDCIPGLYCDMPGLPVPVGSCTSGYYCPAGQSISNPIPCPPGHMCPDGSESPVPCRPGFYQDQQGQAECATCPPQYYCDGIDGPNTNYTQFLCPAGFYCPACTTSGFQYACPVGRYSNASGLSNSSECLPCRGGHYCAVPATSNPSTLCSPGYFCRQGARSATPDQGADAGPCPVGHYCPRGTTQPVACPAGTFSSVMMLERESQCQQCIGGHYCEVPGLNTTSGACSPGFFCPNSSSSNQQRLCTAGNFCPRGSSTPTACPTGTFSNMTGLMTSTECSPCTEGLYCAVTGLTSPSGRCSSGFYCPPGQNTSSPSDFLCPSGMQCPLGSSTPLACRPGTLTQVGGKESCDLCPGGFYCLPQTPNILLCPMGFFCPNGTGNNTRPCPIGTYSNVSGLAAREQCTPCAPGRYCDTPGQTSPTGLCRAGYFCASANFAHSPDNSTDCRSDVDFAPIGGPCPAGSSCAVGSSSAELCRPGTYSNETHRRVCSECPAGHFCLLGEIDFSENICPAGHYCPPGTQYSTQHRCPVGTFNNVTASVSSTDCAPCTAGSFCASEGLSRPTALCSPGWFCSGGARNATDAENGGQCLAGQYCPLGSLAPLSCPAGRYCAAPGLSAPVGPCRSGYWCRLGSVSAAPTDGVTGRRCSSGRYCPEGTSNELPCPVGTFANTSGLGMESECRSCTPGFFCSSPGLATPSGPCSEGYFCPGGQNSSTPSEFGCTLGHHCPLGSSLPQPCSAGFYQDTTLNSICLACPSGYYCPGNTTHPIINYASYPCPGGHFCPTGTRYANQFPCPAGTATQRTGLNDTSQCDPCPSSMACTVPGLTASNAICSPGYYCSSGARSTTPRQLPEEGDICPAGFFCPMGSATPTACPPGTFSNQVMLVDADNCTQCLSGSYCSQTNLTQPSGDCSRGYYCPRASSAAKMELCPRGSYCPAASSVPTPCPAGTYSNHTEHTSVMQCSICDAGRFCDVPGLVAPSGPCSPGYYCPAGSNTSTPSQFICPRGLVCPAGSAEPLQCSAGTFTNSTGSSRCDPCPGGFQCFPVDAANTINNTAPCIAGHYCVGSVGYNPTPCPPGSYSNTTGLSLERQCQPCSSGMFCGTPGLVMPTGPCLPGYFCTSGNIVPNPTLGNDTRLLLPRFPLISDGDGESEASGDGGLCPNRPFERIGGVCYAGHYCPAGTDLPLACPTGSFTSNTEQGWCEACPEGFFCPSGTSNFTAYPCPTGHYCPENTTSAFQYPCPAGTFNNLTHRVNISDCMPCSAGSYCNSSGLSSPSGPCHGGYFCAGGSTVAAPRASLFGRQCLPGEFCPAATAQIVVCTAGFYCGVSGLSAVSGPCDSGYYCPNGSVLARQIICPPGHYCLEGSPRPRPCPAGTYLPWQGSTNRSDCLVCRNGSACSEDGLAQPNANCSKGYYCPQGAVTPTPSQHPCPHGHFCPDASSVPQRCPSGTYQDEQGADFCKTCLAGFFCDNRLAPVVLLTNISLCPEGYFCPNGTRFATQYPCPIGTYSNVSGLSELEDCQPCREGYYCDLLGLVHPSGPCRAGFLCPQGTNTSAPTRGICPRGNYCPTGSILPLPCPPGSFADRLGTQNSSGCQPCDPGLYCNDVTASASASANCSSGFICIGGASVPTPLDNVTGYPCPAGSFCLSGHVLPTLCPVGTFANQTGLGACFNCPSRHVCPNHGTVYPLPCPKGRFCPVEGNNTIGEPCPIGTFSNRSGLQYASECNPCTAGQYCDKLALTEPTGPCNASFFCPEGSRLPHQVPCPVGHYCPERAGQPLPCPVGTFSGVERLGSVETCSPCTAGSYCNGIGQNVSSGLCQAGYYCPMQEAITDPNPQEFQCPRGHYCPEGSPLPLGCPPGTYSPNLQMATCLPCPAGFYCPSNQTQGIPCPAFSYCASEAKVPARCPAGYYTDSNTTGLVAAEDCLPCPAGRYCRQGIIQSNCDAGYICEQASPSPTPRTIDLDLFNQTVGSPCPLGFYCPEGTTRPQRCPGGLFINFEGAGNVSDCGLCPAGKTCPLETTTAQDCRKGYYCPFNSTEVPCPVGTYNNRTGGPDDSYCLPCVAGFWCNREGGASYLSKPCPPGYYCDSGVDQPAPCPPGTYRDSPGAAEIGECYDCPRGYYCPPENGTTFALKCPTGTFCPNGSSSYVDCDAGFYCPDAADRVSCPAGSYCPVRSVTPIPCPDGHYCSGFVCDPATTYNFTDVENTTAGAATSTICPLGHKAERLFNTSFQTSFNDTCLPCKAGSYGGHPSRLNCTECRAGVVCLESATTDNPLTNETTLGYPNTRSYLCPTGYYCPPGSGTPRPCPEGTFQNQLGAMSNDSCTPCPFGQYQHLSGQATCNLCGGEATTTAVGSTSCVCQGTGRTHQVSRFT